MDQAAFVRLVTEGQSTAPGYFSYDADLNRRSHNLLDTTGARALDAAEFLQLRASGALVLDARSPEEFAAGHLVGALNVPVEGRFAEQAGSVVTPDQEVLVIASENRAVEAVTRLARIGFDRVTGFSVDPQDLLLAQPGELRRAGRLTARSLRGELDSSESPVILDVRTGGERALGLIEGSLHIPLAELAQRIGELPATGWLVVHCAGGHRSSIAASLIRRHGRTDVYDLLGGYTAWQDAA
jgi:rhodanese-related sulfurtransferase